MIFNGQSPRTLSDKKYTINVYDPKTSDSKEIQTPIPEDLVNAVHDSLTVFDGKKCHVTPIIVNPELKSLHIGIIEDMKYKYEVTIREREKKKELEEAISMYEDTGVLPKTNPSISFINEHKDVTKEFEIAYPNLSKEFLEIQSQQYELFAKKMLSYGLDNISLGTTLTDEDDVKLSVTSIFIRCWDKINRLKNLIVKQVKNPLDDESIDDTWKDLSVYGIIAQLVSNKKWKR